MINWKKHGPFVLLSLGSILMYLFFAYELERSSFITLIGLYAGFFGLAYLLIERFSFNFWCLAGLGVVIRLLFLPAIPNLSQDFYRFLWDGRLLAQGINPYVFTPAQWMENAPEVIQLAHPIIINQAETLIDGMGSLNASHYSNYPPVNQFFFMLSALFAKHSIVGSVIVLRSIMLLADIGIFYFGRKLLLLLNVPTKRIFWYFLSPFIIIELTGNLHFEGVMLFFLVWSLYLLFKEKWFFAGMLLGLSISVKLLPLLLLPLFFKWFRTKNEKIVSKRGWNFDKLGLSQLIPFYVVILGTVALTFAPFFSAEFLSNFSATISLWFQNFEFNASIYYIIRWIGYQTVGWNIIETVGKILPLLIIVIILWLSFFRSNSTKKQLVTALLFAVTVYFMFSTTVHPWYIATPLLLSIFTRYWFAIVWSAVVFLSYSAYRTANFNENLWLVALEYIIVLGVAIFELNSSSKDLKRTSLSV